MKELIKKYLKKNLTGHPKKNYYFLRWLASLVETKYNTEYVSEMVALFQHYDENRRKFPFTDLFVIDNTIYVYTLRPGLWIGKHGDTIEEIKKMINNIDNVGGYPSHNFEISFIEVDSNTATYYNYAKLQYLQEI